MEYQAALKLGEKAYRNAVARGEYPYLPALDEILSCVEVQREEKLGLVDIPLEQIVGTKTTGRKNAFAVNFMPLNALLIQLYHITGDQTVPAPANTVALNSVV